MLRHRFILKVSDLTLILLCFRQYNVKHVTRATPRPFGKINDHF